MNSNYRRNFVEQTRVPQHASSDNADNLRSYDVKPVTNDGDRGYSETRNQPWSTNTSYLADNEIDLKLAPAGKDITCFDRSWIDMMVHEVIILGDNQVNEMRAAFPVLYDGNHIRDVRPDDPDYHEFMLEKMLAENQFVFIGFKMSSQAIASYKFTIEHDTVLAGSGQTQAIDEQYLYYVFKDADEIANKKYVYSPYKEVDNFENSMCGTWLPLYKLLQGSFEVTFPLLIPYQTFLPLQSFDKYPTFLFGEFGMIIKTSCFGQVWTEVNPLASIKKAILSREIENHEDFPELTSILACPKETWGYHRAFQQMGLRANVCFCTGVKNEGGVDQLQFYTGMLSPKVDTYWVTTPVTYTHGYNLRTDVKDQLKQEFLCAADGGGDKAFVICGQRIDFYQLGNTGGQSQGSFSITQTIPFRHTTDLYITYPMNPAQRTVFYNPCLEQHSVSVAGIVYPSQSLTTMSPQFYMDQFLAADFVTSIFKATDEYENSLTNTRVCEKGYREPTTDDTNFVEAVPLCNPYASPTSDDSLNKTSEVRLYGTSYPRNFPLYSVENPDPNMQSSGPPAPHCLICQDVYLIFRRVKNPETRADRTSVQYVKEGTFLEAIADYKVEGVVSR